MAYKIFMAILLLCCSNGYAMNPRHFIHIIAPKQGGSSSKTLMVFKKREWALVPLKHTELTVINKKGTAVAMMRPSQIPLIIETRTDLSNALVQVEQKKEKIQSELHAFAGVTDQLHEKHTSLCRQSILLHEKRQKSAEKCDLEPENTDTKQAFPWFEPGLAVDK